MTEVVPDGGVMHRVGALDGVRGLAVLFVLLFHAGGVVLGGFLLQSGVDLFFVLSGFLITTILIRTKERSDYFRLFYLRRFVRIFPLYYLVLAAMLTGAAVAIHFGVQSKLGYPEAQNLLDNQLWGWLYQVNNLIAFKGPIAFPGMSHLWSLSVEEQFYLAWPLVVLLTPKKRLFAVSLGVVAFSFVFRSFSYALVSRDFAYHFTLCRLDGLALGAAGAVLLQSPSLRARFDSWIRWAGRHWWVVFVLLIMPEPVALYPGFTILSLGYLGLVLSAHEGWLADRPTRWLGSRFLLELGTYSYAIYVFQFPITKAVLPITPTNVQLLDTIFHILVIGGLSYLLARISWVAWERPWLRLKRRFAYS
jgi:peptidoglycan/LPS O-acetylase OafA/YrhL